jgi:CheY-like chemotaxis protein
MELCRSFEPNVMVIDIGLPGLNGYEVAQRVRAMPEGARILLIALTGYGQDTDLRAAKQAGFDHHFTKPVNPEEIHRVIVTRVSANTAHEENGETESAQNRRAIT